MSDQQVDSHEPVANFPTTITITPVKDSPELAYPAASGATDRVADERAPPPAEAASNAHVAQPSISLTSSLSVGWTSNTESSTNDHEDTGIEQAGHLAWRRALRKHPSKRSKDDLAALIAWFQTAQFPFFKPLQSVELLTAIAHVCWLRRLGPGDIVLDHDASPLVRPLLEDFPVEHSPTHSRSTAAFQTPAEPSSPISSVVPPLDKAEAATVDHAHALAFYVVVAGEVLGYRVPLPARTRGAPTSARMPVGSKHLFRSDTAASIASMLAQEAERTQSEHSSSGTTRSCWDSDNSPKSGRSERPHGTMSDTGAGGHGGSERRRDDSKPIRLTKGMGFGALSVGAYHPKLAQRKRRRQQRTYTSVKSATASLSAALEPCEVLVIPESVYRKALKSLLEARVLFLKSMSEFSLWSVPDCMSLALHMTTRQLSPHSTIFRQHDMPSSLFVVQRGECVIQAYNASAKSWSESAGASSARSLRQAAPGKGGSTIASTSAMQGHWARLQKQQTSTAMRKARNMMCSPPALYPSADKAQAQADSMGVSLDAMRTFDRFSHTLAKKRMRFYQIALPNSDSFEVHITISVSRTRSSRSRPGSANAHARRSRAERACELYASLQDWFPSPYSVETLRVLMGTEKGDPSMQKARRRQVWVRYNRMLRRAHARRRGRGGTASMPAVEQKCYMWRGHTGVEDPAGAVADVGIVVSSMDCRVRKLLARGHTCLSVGVFARRNVDYTITTREVSTHHWPAGSHRRAPRLTPVATLGPGTLFGLADAVHNVPRSFTAATRTNVTLLEVSKTDFARHIPQHHIERLRNASLRQQRLWLYSFRQLCQLQRERTAARALAAPVALTGAHVVPGTREQAVVVSSPARALTLPSHRAGGNSLLEASQARWQPDDTPGQSGRVNGVWSFLTDVSTPAAVSAELAVAGTSPSSEPLSLGYPGFGYSVGGQWVDEELTPPAKNVGSARLSPAPTTDKELVGRLPTTTLQALEYHLVAFENQHPEVKQSLSRREHKLRIQPDFVLPTAWQRSRPTDGSTSFVLAQLARVERRQARSGALTSTVPGALSMSSSPTVRAVAPPQSHSHRATAASAVLWGSVRKLPARRRRRRKQGTGAAASPLREAATTYDAAPRQEDPRDGARVVTEQPECARHKSDTIGVGQPGNAPHPTSKRRVFTKGTSSMEVVIKTTTHVVSSLDDGGSVGSGNTLHPNEALAGRQPRHPAVVRVRVWPSRRAATPQPSLPGRPRTMQRARSAAALAGPAKPPSLASAADASRAHAATAPADVCSTGSRAVRVHVAHASPKLHAHKPPHRDRVRSSRRLKGVVSGVRSRARRVTSSTSRVRPGTAPHPAVGAVNNSGWGAQPPRRSSRRATGMLRVRSVPLLRKTHRKPNSHSGSDARTTRRYRTPTGGDKRQNKADSAGVRLAGRSAATKSIPRSRSKHKRVRPYTAAVSSLGKQLRRRKDELRLLRLALSPAGRTEYGVLYRRTAVESRLSA